MRITARPGRKKLSSVNVGTTQSPSTSAMVLPILFLGPYSARFVLQAICTEWTIDPLVASIVTTLVVSGFPLSPIPQLETHRSAATPTNATIRNARRLLRRSQKIGASITAAAGRPEVRFSLTVAVPAPATMAGEKTQEYPRGTPETQLKVTLPLKPAIGATVSFTSD